MSMILLMFWVWSWLVLFFSEVISFSILMLGLGLLMVGRLGVIVLIMLIFLLFMFSMV